MDRLMLQQTSRREQWDHGKARETLARFTEVRSDGRRGSEYQQLRGEVVVAHLNLVRFLALKFANRGEPLDDLVQVGTLGLIKAIDRFDVERGVEFVTYAGPTIIGEIKRHFRDKGWTLRVPRRLQELNLALNRAIEQLGAKFGRSPTAADLAEHLHASEEEILQAMEARHAYRAMSLDVALSSAESGKKHLSLEESFGASDLQLVRCEDATALERAFEVLSGRERTIVYWRFFDRVPQREIARRLSVSQMHVSRIQQKALQKMREVLQD